jgi:uncharacterized lipoprotein NlpE involved in copper resistance
LQIRKEDVLAKNILFLISSFSTKNSQMEKYFLVGFLLFVCFCFQSCSSSQQTTLEGTYYGILPCASCMGINTKLVLRKDNTYQKTELYNKGGRLEIIRPIETTGTYILNDGILVLSTEEEGMNKFKINSKTELEMLDLEGNPIDYLHEMFILRKNEKPADFSLESIYPEKVGGIGFKATGNEPFWSLEIDFSKRRMLFKNMERGSLEVYKSVPFENEKGASYESQNGELKVRNIK